MMEPMDVDAVVGVLKRKQGVLGRMKKFTYVKKGVFLYEFKTSQHYDSDPPRRLYDISGAKVFPLDSTTNPSLSFRLVTRSSEEIDFVAEDDEEMKKWFDSLATTVERTSFMSCAALIAPVRRRQSSASFTMKKKFMKSISIVKIGKDAGIKEVDKATTLMFGLKEEDLIGQSVKALLVDDSCRRFLEHFKSYLADPASQARPAPVRNMNGYRKNKEEFPISLSLDKVDENTFRLKILDRSGPSMESAGNNEKDDFKTMATLRVDVMEGRDIGMSKKKTNPYCVILLDDTEKTTTTTKPNTTTPFWGQEYVFDDIKPTNKKVTIMINNQNKSIMDPRIGVVDINIFELNPGGRLLDKWFTVNPTPGSSTKSQGSPSIRLKIALTVEKILPFKEYKDILDLFLDEKLTCAMAVAKATTSQLDEVAGTLVNIFAMKNRVTDFVRKLTALEVSKTDRGNILFRGNSLGTKVIDLYMKMVGFDYLQETLTPLIEEVLHDKERCEVDPTRLLKGEDIKKNQKRLIMYTKKFFDRIAASVSKCPSEMKMVFSNLRAEVVKKFSDIENHTSVSGFVFLRFFCPAILNPKMFGITEEHPDGTAARNLTLIAKAIQNLANLVPQAKELFMTFMEEFLESQLKPMQDCVSQFCTLNEDSTFEFSGVVNKKDLSREMAALYRHCVDSKEQLMNTMLDDPDSKLNDLFKCLQALEKRQMEYERKALEQIKNHPIMHRPSISLSGIQE